jgi:hypothetical protein
MTCNPYLTLDVGVDVGLNLGAPKYTVTVGVSTTFGKVFGKS